MGDRSRLSAIGYPLRHFHLRWPFVRDGRQLVVPSLGFPFALNLIDQPATADRKVTQIPQGFLSTPGVEVYAGVAYSPDGKLLYVATGDSGAVEVRPPRIGEGDRADHPEWDISGPCL